MEVMATAASAGVRDDWRAPSGTGLAVISAAGAMMVGVLIVTIILTVYLVAKKLFVGRITRSARIGSSSVMQKADYTATEASSIGGRTTGNPGQATLECITTAYNVAYTSDKWVPTCVANPAGSLHVEPYATYTLLQAEPSAAQ